MSLAVEVEMLSPQEAAAQRYMTRKGYPDAKPYATDKIEDMTCWYFSYRLPDGDLELDVYFDHGKDDWVFTVSNFVVQA